MEYQVMFVLGMHYRQAEDMRRKLEKLTVEQRISVEGMVREYCGIPSPSRKRELRRMIALIIGYQPSYNGNGTLN